MNTSSGSQKKLAPIKTTKNSPRSSSLVDGEKMDSNGDEESNISSNSSCDQSQLNNNNNVSNSTSMNQNSINNQSNNNSKKRGRPRLYEMNPTTGKSIKGM